MHKILVIEDNESVRFNILELLQVENFHTIEAENGYVGVQMAKEKIPDLIICDIIMPEMDGYSVRDALCEDSVTTRIPFIFLSAKAEKADVRLGIALGADDYLTKPFTRDELLEAVFACLDKKVAADRHFNEKIDKLRGSITESLPYELLIPLNQIKDFLQTLKNKYDLLDQHKILEMTKGAYASSLRLQGLIQNFLFYALLEITTANPDQVNALRNSCISLTKSVITNVAVEKAEEFERKTDLHLELHDVSVPILEANLAKIVEELIDNAFKFSTVGTPVRIESLVDNNMFLLYVINEGQGLTPDQIANLGAYVQFERNLYKQEGSGLGLAIAKRLCELYAGELTIDSIPGKKTTVCVALPILS